MYIYFNVIGTILIYIDRHIMRENYRYINQNKNINSFFFKKKFAIQRIKVYAIVEYIFCCN